MRRLAVTAALVALAACSSTAAPPAAGDPSPAGAQAPRRVELLVGRARVDVLAASLAEARPLLPSYRGPRALHWELRGPAGAVLARGAVADPRVARDESSLVDETTHHDSRVAGTIGTVTLETPNVDGELVILDGGEVGRVTLSALAADRVAQPLFSPSRDLVGAPEKIVDHGTASGLVNVLVVPEGYTRAELAKFRADTASMIAQLKDVPGYRELWHGFNVWRQDIASTDSGITDPTEGTRKSTAFDAHFGDDRTRARRCVLPADSVRTQAMANLRATVTATGADITVILVNEDEYAGCAIPSERIIVQTRNTQATRVLAHELGHAPFLLADEYSDGDCDPSRWQPGSDWHGVNVTNSLTSLPWSDLVSRTSLPTRASAAGADVVGAFEGAGYCTTGVFRPQHRCLMRALSNDWCKVCHRELVRYFAARGVTPDTGAAGDAGADASGAADGSAADAASPADAGVSRDAGAAPAVTQVTATNRTGTGLWVRCAGTVGPSCTDWTYAYDGYADTGKAPGGRITIDNTTVTGPRVRFAWRAVTAPTANVSIYANAADPLRP